MPELNGDERLLASIIERCCKLRHIQLGLIVCHSYKDTSHQENVYPAKVRLRSQNSIVSVFIEKPIQNAIPKNSLGVR
jgi:hypothetical protein